MSVQILEFHAAQQLKKLVPRPGNRYSIKRFNFPRPEGIIPEKVR